MNNTRDRRPQFTFPQGRGYTPPPEPVPFGVILFCIACWLVFLAAATAFLLPMATQLVHWVLRHG